METSEKTGTLSLSVKTLNTVATTIWTVVYFVGLIATNITTTIVKYLTGQRALTGGSFRHEMDKIDEKSAAAAAKRTQAGTQGTSDMSIWMRDFQNDIESPLNPTKVHGKIPEWLEGTLVRNGPGRHTFGDSRYKHLFDCAAVLHRFRIDQGGKVSYLAKQLKSKAFLTNLKANRIVVSEFGTAGIPDPCKSIFSRVSSSFKKQEMTDNCLVSVYPFGDALYAMTETPNMHRINTENMESLERVNVAKKVNIVHHSAHPQVESDGSVYNIGLSVSDKVPKYSIVSFKSPKKDHSEMVETCKIETLTPARWRFNPSYMHSFGITPNYFIIIEQPLVVSVARMMVNNVRPNSFASSLVWYDDEPTLIHLVSRNGKGTKTFKSEPFFFFHTINHYEDGDNLVLDLCAYRDAKLINHLYLEEMMSVRKSPDYASMMRARPVRLVIPLNGNENEILVPKIISDIGCELPRFNYNLLGQNYRYFYAMSADVDSGKSGFLIKVDVKTGSNKIWGEEGLYPGEPIFVPRPGSKDEDDGVVVTALLNAEDENHVSLLVLDARTFEEVARADFHSPEPVPNCFHGWFVQ